MIRCSSAKPDDKPVFSLEEDERHAVAIPSPYGVRMLTKRIVGSYSSNLYREE
jgi:hypothetical protein